MIYTLAYLSLMTTNSTLVSKLYTFLIDKKIIRDVFDNTYLFYDEPKFYSYAALINKLDPKSLSLSDYSLVAKEIHAGGISSTSKELALLKCLGETIERLCLYFFPNKADIKNTYVNFPENTAISPSLYTQNTSSNSWTFDWVEGVNHTLKTKSFIPAQLIYIDYHVKTPEPHLSAMISTGGAGGVMHEDTLLRGIYEVIERDSFMTTYINKTNIPLIDISTIDDSNLKYIINKCFDYQLIPYVFDATTDLEIPTYVTYLIDNTKIGPAITVGAKASSNNLKAIVGSIEEAAMTRPWIRMEMSHTKLKTKPDNISEKVDRALYWARPEMIKHLMYLFKQKPQPLLIRDNQFLSTTQELNHITKKLRTLGYSIYYKDTTLPIFRELNYRVYKVVIPGLQPLSLNERLKSWDIIRLKKVAKYFGQHKNIYNKLPHPFV